jgi:hypothetical protein
MLPPRRIPRPDDPLMGVQPRALRVARMALVLFFLIGVARLDAAEENRRTLFGEGLTFLYDPRDEALAERLWPVMARDRLEVMDRLGLYPEGALRVLLATSREEFAEALGGAMPDALGLYFPATRTVVLRSPRTLTGGDWDPRGVMRHELAHGVLDLALDRPIPRWLNEGLAILISGEASFLDESNLAYLAFREKLLPLRLLMDGFPDGHGLDLAYLEAASFARFLVRRAGTDGIRQMLVYLASGQGLDRSFALTYGEPLERLEAMWRDDLSGRFSWWAMVTPLSVLGGLGGPLVVAGYLRRKLQARRRLREWEAEGEPGSIAEGTAEMRGESFPSPLRPSAAEPHGLRWRPARPPPHTES